MNVEEITFEDLLAGEPACAGLPLTYKQLLAEGFPYRGGLEVLAAIQRMPDPGPELVAVQRGYLQILKLQEIAG